jgi:uncharacterized protein (TIGR02145 family)
MIRKFSIQCLVIIIVMIQLISCNNKKEIKSVKPLIDTRDGQEYKCKQIGDQIWMVENLAYETKSHNSYFYADNPSKYKEYGRLYFPEDIVEAAGIPGWHVPDTSEWLQLLEYYNLDKGNFGRRKNHGKCEQWDKEHFEEIKLFQSNEKNGFNFQFGGLWHFKWTMPNTERLRYFEYIEQSGYYWALPLDNTHRYTHIGMGVYKYNWMEVTSEKPSSTYKSGDRFRFYLRFVKD